MPYPRTIEPVAFRELAELIHFKSGILLDESKKYLIETRLGPLLDELQLDTYTELCRRAVRDRQTLSRLIDEISTNETSWFRDKSPFDLLKFKLLPDLMDRLQGRPDSVSIWSAASSTGQEVYSIAMTAVDILPATVLQRTRITGTDISDAAVRRASLGQYSDFEIERGLTAALRDRHFKRADNGWRVNDQLRSMVMFKTFNLLDPLVTLGSVDIVFCRNVAIYFDLPTRKQLFERIARQIRPGGALVIGSSETLHGVTDHFERHEHMRSSYYVPKL